MLKTRFTSILTSLCLTLLIGIATVFLIASSPAPVFAQTTDPSPNVESSTPSSSGEKEKDSSASQDKTTDNRSSDKVAPKSPSKSPYDMDDIKDFDDDVYGS